MSGFIRERINPEGREAAVLVLAVCCLVGALFFFAIGSLRAADVAATIGLAAFAGLVLGITINHLRDRLPRRVRIQRSRAARAGWTELLLGLGAIFLILAIVVFALLVLEPVVNHPGAWDPWLAVLGGALGLLLIFAGILHRRGGR